VSNRQRKSRDLLFAAILKITDCETSVTLALSAFGQVVLSSQGQVQSDTSHAVIVYTSRARL
jgi:hypothetical protein